MAKDYVLEIRVKNGPLLRAMRRCGHQNARQLSLAAGVDACRVGQYLGLKIAPINSKGAWKPSVLKLAAALKTLPEDLFPPQHINEPLSCNRAELAVDLHEVAGVLAAPDDPEKLMLRAEVVDGLYAAIGSLTPREQAVLTERFGLDGGGVRTLEDISFRMNITRERIRQIEQKALRSLRHPSRSANLTSFGALLAA